MERVNKKIKVIKRIVADASDVALAFALAVVCRKLSPTQEQSLRWQR